MLVSFFFFGRLLVGIVANSVGDVYNIRVFSMANVRRPKDTILSLHERDSDDSSLLETHTSLERVCEGSYGYIGVVQYN